MPACRKNGTIHARITIAYFFSLCISFGAEMAEWIKKSAYGISYKLESWKNSDTEACHKFRHIQVLYVDKDVIHISCLVIVWLYQFKQFKHLYNFSIGIPRMFSLSFFHFHYSSLARSCSLSHSKCAPLYFTNIHEKNEKFTNCCRFFSSFSQVTVVEFFFHTFFLAFFFAPTFYCANSECDTKYVESLWLLFHFTFICSSYDLLYSIVFFSFIKNDFFVVNSAQIKKKYKKNII